MQGKEKEYMKVWGSTGLVIRHSFVCEVKLTPGKGNSKQISFWDAKKMLEKLGVIYDHVQNLSKSQDVELKVRLVFFQWDAYENGTQIVAGQPNNTIFYDGRSLTIQLEAVANSPRPVNLPAFSPGFDRKEKGCRPDTIHIKALPAKWFDVKTSTFYDELSDHSQVDYMRLDHTLHKLFKEFGDISAIEVLPPATISTDSTDSSSLVSTSHFDIYVQYKKYESVLDILAAFSGGRVLCHSSHSKVIVPLDIELDRSEYLSDAKCRQRRFSRERRQHEQEEEAAQAAAAEKAELIAVEDARLQVTVLSDELVSLIDEAKEIDVTIPQIEMAEAALNELRSNPSKNRVDTVKKALDRARSQIDREIKAAEEKMMAQRRSQWKKSISAAVKSGEVKLNKLNGQLQKATTNYTELCEHPAIIADLSAAKDALKAASKSTAPMANLDASTEADVQQHLDKMYDDSEEASFMVHAVVERLKVVESYHKVEEQVKAMEDSKKFHVDGSFRTIEQEWGASTEVLREKIQDVQDRINAVQEFRILSEKFHSIVLPSTADEALRSQYSSCTKSVNELLEPIDISSVQNQVDELKRAVLEHENAEAKRKSQAYSLPVQFERVQSARKRLQEWRDSNGLTREFTVDKLFHMSDRWNEPRVKKPRMFKHLNPSSGMIPSIILVQDPKENDKWIAPKTDEQRRTEEMERLRVQVIESMKRKEAVAAMQRLKEKELREQVLKSMKGHATKV